MFIFKVSVSSMDQRVPWSVLSEDRNRTLFVSNEIVYNKGESKAACLPRTKDLQYTISIPPGSFRGDDDSLSIFGANGNRIFSGTATSAIRKLSLLNLIEPNSEWHYECQYRENWNSYESILRTKLIPTSATCQERNSIRYYSKSFTGRKHFAAYEVRFNYRGGIVAYLNGVEIYRDNLSSGELDQGSVSQGAYSSYTYRGIIRNGGEISCVNCFLAVAIYPVGGEDHSVEMDAYSTFDAWLAVYHGSDASSQAYAVPCLAASILISPEEMNPTVSVDLSLSPARFYSVRTSTPYLTVRTPACQLSYWRVGNTLYDRFEPSVHSVRSEDSTSFYWKKRRNRGFSHSIVLPGKTSIATITGSEVIHHLDIGNAFIKQGEQIGCIGYIVNEVDGEENMSVVRKNGDVLLRKNNSPMADENKATYTIEFVILIVIITILIFIVILLIVVIFYICMKQRNPKFSLTRSSVTSGNESVGDKGESVSGEKSAEVANGNKEAFSSTNTNTNTNQDTFNKASPQENSTPNSLQRPDSVSEMRDLAHAERLNSQQQQQHTTHRVSRHYQADNPSSHPPQQHSSELQPIQSHHHQQQQPNCMPPPPPQQQQQSQSHLMDISHENNYQPESQQTVSRVSHHYQADRPSSQQHHQQYREAQSVAPSDHHYRQEQNQYHQQYRETQSVAPSNHHYHQEQNQYHQQYRETQSIAPSNHHYRQEQNQYHQQYRETQSVAPLHRPIPPPPQRLPPPPPSQRQQQQKPDQLPISNRNDDRNQSEENRQHQSTPISQLPKTNSTVTPPPQRIMRPPSSVLQTERASSIHTHTSLSLPINPVKPKKQISTTQYSVRPVTLPALPLPPPNSTYRAATKREGNQH